MSDTCTYCRVQIRVLLIVFGCVFSLASSATAQQGDLSYEAQVDHFQLYSNCGLISIFVNELSSDAEEIGLENPKIQAAAESRLRSARLYTEADPAVILEITVQVFRSAFSVRLSLYKTVFDPLTEINYSSATWTLGSIGTHGSDASFIIRSLSQHLDTFLADYLRVNETACGQSVVTPSSQSTSLTSGVRVFGRVGRGKWPLKGIDEGRIICRGEDDALPTSPPYSVFFKSATGDFYALNGQAMRRTSTRIRQIMLDEPTAAMFQITSTWISAGVALCRGDIEEARRFAGVANRKAAE